MAESGKDAKDDGEQAAPAPKKSKRLVLFAAIGLLVLAIGGAAGWFLTRPGNDPHAAELARQKKERQEKKARVFLPLEQFTVNLADEGDRFAQVAIVLEVANGDLSEDIKAVMPTVRDRILLLLSSKSATELLTLHGKEVLAREIAEATVKAIDWKPSANDRKAGGAEVSDKDIAEGEAAADPAEGEASADATEGKAGKAARTGSRERAARGRDAAGPAPLPVEVRFSQFIVQ